MMNAQNDEIREHKNDYQGRLISGLILVLIGILALTAQFVDTAWMGMLFLPLLGLIFLVWGSLTRQFGLIIPGGVLSGIGLGAFLIGGPLSYLPEEASGGVFMLSFAAGWALMTVMSALVVRPVRWWPMIPGALIGLVGAALLSGGAALKALALVGQGWPLILIAIGLYLLLFRKGLQK